MTGVQTCALPILPSRLLYSLSIVFPRLVLAYLDDLVLESSLRGVLLSPYKTLEESLATAVNYKFISVMLALCCLNNISSNDNSDEIHQDKPGVLNC